jgi:hypothetical protein
VGEIRERHAGSFLDATRNLDQILDQKKQPSDLVPKGSTAMEVRCTEKIQDETQ